MIAHTSASGNEKRLDYRTVKISVLLGIVLYSADNFFYAANRAAFNNQYSSPEYAYISLFIFALASSFIGFSASSFLRVQRLNVRSDNNEKATGWHLGEIVSDALSHQKRLFFSAIVVYALFFAFLDGILIFQPGVNFFTSYVVHGVTWRVETCCGLPGNIPVGLLYLPAQHIGVELIPSSVILMILVSVMVGLNACLLYRAYNLSRTQRVSSANKATIGGVVGAAFGLFVGCPTCAAAFFLSTIAGAGAMGFSAFISASQPFIAAISLPLLFFSIVWQARSIKTILKGCSIQQVKDRIALP